MIYNVGVKFPKRIRGMIPTGTKTIEYSRHALRESNRDRYGVFALPRQINFADLKVVEAEVYSNKLEKIVARLQLDEKRDRVLVLIPTGDKKTWFCKTAWINLRDDNHSTLKRERYA